MNRRTALKQVLCAAATINGPLDQMVLNMVEQLADWNMRTGRDEFRSTQTNFGQEHLRNMLEIARINKPYEILPNRRLEIDVPNPHAVPAVRKQQGPARYDPITLKKRPRYGILA